MGAQGNEGAVGRPRFGPSSEGRNIGTGRWGVKQGLSRCGGAVPPLLQKGRSARFSRAGWGWRGASRAPPKGGSGSTPDHPHRLRFRSGTSPAEAGFSAKPGKGETRGGGAALALSQGKSPGRNPNGDAAKKRLTPVQEQYMNKMRFRRAAVCAVRAGGAASDGRAGAKKHGI